MYVKAPLEEQKQQERARFVFMQPRLDMTTPKPPPRAELSDLDRRARTVERSPNPENSLLLIKPTNRIAHTGGRRIVPGGPEEAALRAWVLHLTTLPAAGAARVSAESARRSERTVLRRMTHSQYNATVRALLRDSTKPSKNFPPEDFVNGFRNQYESLSISPILADALSSSSYA